MNTKISPVEGSKACIKCAELKPLSRFYKHSTGIDGRRTDCIDCHLEAGRALTRKPGYKRKPPNNNRRDIYGRHLKRRYGISISTYDEMCAAQNNACAICNSTERKSNNGFLCVDHCHKTGRIRGLLCYRCNRALGHLGDNEISFWKILQYIASPIGEVT